MPSFEQLVVQAALDVAVERLTRLYPRRQFFIFGAKGDPFFAHFEPSLAELELLNRALFVLEKSETRPAPFVVRGASGQFTAMVLDAERSLFAVVLWIPANRKPGETRVDRVQGPVQAPTWRD
ncbi:MAG: hypothetical protein Q8K32_01035 [Archangium sp.]|nr:hypothetical protein [Archangium sp.]